MSKALAKKAMVLALAAITLLVAAIGLLTWLQFTGSREARIGVRHALEVIIAAKELDIALREAESGQRGYLLTGEESYLAPYNGALARVTLLEDALRRLTADNPDQQDRLRGLAPVVQRKLDELARSVVLRHDVGAEAALAVVRTHVGQELMADITARLARLQAEEERVLRLRVDASDRAETLTRGLALAGAVLAVGLLAAAAGLLSRTRHRLVAAEAEQRVLAAQMRTALDSISQGVGVFDARHALARWNESFPILLGLPPPLTREGVRYGAIAGQVAAMNGDDALLETEDQIRHGRGARAAGLPVIYERTRAADGRSFEMRRTAMPDGGFVLTVSDITERMRAEASARAGQRLQATGQLTGGIAHDFNNLLTVVMGNLEFAQSRLPEGSPILARLERAMWATRRGAAMTQQLLAFARKQPLVPMPIDISTMLPDMANLLRRTLGAHIDIRTVDAAGLWPALADPTQVESALLNLALNARDAMPGGGRLTIELANKVLDDEYAHSHAEVRPGDYVMLAVSDSGSGMPSEVLARAFEPFFTTKEPGKGTGLGLAMVFGFAKQSGGHVKIYSEPGQGTTVRLYLPRAVGAVPSAAPCQARPIDLPRGAATVLVVEDDASVREVAVTILRDLGYRVLEAGDGAEALRVFGANGARVDLLLVDVVLPGGTKGDEVARRLAELRPDQRVLFMSGYTENAIIHHGRLDDGVHLIAKPFQREQLARKVAEVLGVSGAPARAAGDGKMVDLGARDRGRLT